MIIYEVNLTVNHNKASEFKLWLTDHIRDMLNFPGFQSAELYQTQLSETQESVEFVVMYTIDAPKSLNHYLENHSKTMREEALSRFPNQFTVTRRVLCEAYLI